MKEDGREGMEGREAGRERSREGGRGWKGEKQGGSEGIGNLSSFQKE